ncbi:MAG: M1 family aminopeptidase, partial [Planctomycetota bacterium]
SNVDGLTTFDVRLSNSFPDAATSVLVNGSPAAWSRISSTTLRITLDQTYNTGETFDVTVSYDGQAIGAGFGSIVWANDSLGRPFVYTLSETDFAYTWWPTKDDNTDKATADLRFTVPSDLTVASNGLLQSNTVAGPGLRTFHFRTDYPTATYLFCFGLGKYGTQTNTYSWGTGSMPVEYYVLETSNPSGVIPIWAVCEDMLGVFEPLLGPYPFRDEKYGMYQFGFGGGMEHQTMTGQGTLSESVTAHELGHQWFGDKITCATWNHIWLNEGFATYTEALWYEYEFGSSNKAALRNAMLNRTPSNVNDTVYVSDTSNISRIFNYDLSYLKGGWVVHMLRHVLGDAEFFQMLADYQAAHAYGAATTEDLQAVAETIYGDQLDWFFDQWIYQPGAPSYRSAVTTHTAGGQIWAEIYLQQVQGSPSPQVFTMPVDVRINTTAGSVDASVWNDARSEHFLVPISGNATSVEVDRDDWILAQSNFGTSFAAGPPKIVVTDPAPGETMQDGGDPISVTFHKNVVAGAGDFSLVGTSVGSVAFSFGYNAGTFEATLTPLSVLAPDTYTLTVADSVIAADVARALDGEVVADQLPSGNGSDGGDATIVFVVPPVDCPGDVNGSGDVTLDDFTILAGNFGGGPGLTRADGDLSGDGFVNLADFTILANNFGSVCN